MSLDARRNRPENWPAAVFALILRVAVLVAFAYVLYRVGFIIVMVLMAVMLALTVVPLVDWLRKSAALRLLPEGARRSAATSIVFLLLALGLAWVVGLILHPLALETRELTHNWRNYTVQWGDRIQTLGEHYRSSFPPEARQWLEEQGRKWAQEQGGKDVGALVGQQLHTLSRRTLESGALLLELFLVPVLAFSFLTESRPLKREFAHLLPRGRVRDGLYVLRQIGTILQSYAIGQLILAAIAGGVVWVLLSVLRIPGALALAVVAAVTRVIPVIGPLVGGIPIVLISTVKGWQPGLTVLIAFTVMHIVESKVIMPRVIGYRINLHPAVVIIVLLIGAEFFGMWGMFLAAPVAAIIKSLLHYFFVRPRLIRRPPPSAPQAPVSEKEREVGHPAVASIRSHSGAH